MQQRLQSLGIQGTSSGGSGGPVVVNLAKNPTAQTGGTRVSGSSAGSGDEIYISGKAGTLYADGTFEFFGVSPGTHRIIKTLGNTVTAGAVLVGNGNVEGVALRSTPILPVDVFEEPSTRPANEAIPESKALNTLSIVGRVLDETTKEEITEGTVTIGGYGGTRRTFAIVAGNGFFVRDLLPGTYRITINVAGYRASTQTVTVDSEDLKLDLIAQKEAQR